MPEHTQAGTVISASRRNAVVLTPAGQEIKGRIGSKLDEPVAGDQVICTQEEDRWTISQLQPRKNVLKRSYRGASKTIAANLDQIVIVTAYGPLHNPTFIDRVIVAANIEEIPFTIVVNKSDLAQDEDRAAIEVYHKLGFKVLPISVKADDGLAAVENLFADSELHTVALTGVSGVGKSSLLNHFVPGARQRTNEVSEKTGQGRQTTSMACGWVYPRPNAGNLLLIDLPGIQNFGVTDLPEERIAQAFVDIAEQGRQCEFDNCSHIGEHECAVKRAVHEGRLSISRYQSYVDIIEEIRGAREY